METRLPPKQKIVGSTPTEIVIFVFFFLSFTILFYYYHHLHHFHHTHHTHWDFLSSLFLSSLYFFVSFYSFFILYHKQGWPSGLRRQFKVLFSSEAWVRTPLLAFFLFFLIFFFSRIFSLFYFFLDGLLA